MKKHLLHSLASEKLEPFIHQAMKEKGAIGLSLAVVEAGKIVFSKGYGVTKIHSQHKVDPLTRMMIGSITKPLTAAMIATHVDTGRFHWDDSVCSIYPPFKVKDKTLTENIKFKQLLNAASGMPRKDLAFFLNYRGKTAENLLEKIAHIAPTQTNDITFQYTNHMVSAAGYIAGHITHPELTMKAAYDAIMQDRLFGPLNMKRTTFDHDAVLHDPNHATPHGQDLVGNYVSLTPDDERCMGYLAPSGGAWSTVDDLAHFLMTELNNGVTVDGKRLLSEENVQYRRKPQINVSEGLDYGLCWFIENYKGNLRIHHAGRTMGFSSLLSFFPEQNCGIVILSNCVNDAFLLDAIHEKIAELWFETNENANIFLRSNLEQQQQQIEKFKKEERDPHFLCSFVGTYKNKEVADFRIEKFKDDFILHADGFQTRLTCILNAAGKKVLIGLDPPWTWIGLELIPINENSASFVLSLRDEEYIFTKIE